MFSVILEKEKKKEGERETACHVKVSPRRKWKQCLYKILEENKEY